MKYEVTYGGGRGPGEWSDSVVVEADSFTEAEFIARSLLDSRRFTRDAEILLTERVDEDDTD